MKTVHKTADVFGVSRDIPLSYVERNSVDTNLLDNLTREKHVIIYGSSKQGKTCLRRHCLNEEDYILIQCQNSWDIAKLNEGILKSSGYEVEISSSKTSDGKTKLQATFTGGGSFFGLAKAEGSGGLAYERGSSSTINREPLQLDPGDPNDLVRALKQIGFSKYIILEDFHYLPQETQEQFAFTLKTIHEISKFTFVIVAVWKEENRLILYNGDLAGRVVSIDADIWTTSELQEVIQAGEQLLNIQFSNEFKNELIEHSLGSVYIVQDCCYRACRSANIVETQTILKEVPSEIRAGDLVLVTIREQSARYQAFLNNFAAGFQDTQLQMYRWILYPVIKTELAELQKGLGFRAIRKSIQSKHPEGQQLNPGNIVQALYSVPALQSKKNIKPFILDYDRNNALLSVVDKGFMIWLAVQDRNEVLKNLDLPED